MKYKTLGRTGLKVRAFALGTANFGPLADETESGAIMDAAFEAGINFFDTANIYGALPNMQGYPGYTEEIMGRWLQAHPERRSKIVLATKFCGTMGQGPNDQCFSAYHIRNACEESLRRLKADHIDLYQIHSYSPSPCLEEIFQAMEQLVQEGKILYIGTSNWPAWEIVRAHSLAANRKTLGFVSEQCFYCLANRQAERELLPAASTLGVGILPWGPLSGGLLGGVLEKISSGRRALPGLKKIVEDRKEQLEQWKSFCKDLGYSPSQVALAWLLAQPSVTAPILGPRILEQLKSSLPALEVELTEESLKILDKIWPPIAVRPKVYTLE